MKCPNCDVNLLMTDRSGIEIDYCPECRGIWLDRGELDKIIERSTQDVKSQQQDRFPENRQYYPKDKEYRYKKKKGLLEDLFDF